MRVGLELRGGAISTSASLYLCMEDDFVQEQKTSVFRQVIVCNVRSLKQVGGYKTPLLVLMKHTMTRTEELSTPDGRFLIQMAFQTNKRATLHRTV